MSVTHTRDPWWKTDLIWNYFHTVTTPAKAPAYRKFYSNQDRSDELDNRHRVYEMLVDEPLHTHPTLSTTSTDESMENYKKSKLPWNQNNGGFLKAVNNEYWCGSIGRSHGGRGSSMKRSSIAGSSVMKRRLDKGPQFALTPSVSSILMSVQARLRRSPGLVSWSIADQPHRQAVGLWI
ncbi:hypothetical protein ABIB82_006655 [Bradyrhizobium sp. i1.8.4]|uniref:hypothetical protein n=1 Tax=unclassified Bradyrhizobium TaxID=2631580 RepID=UPI003D1EED01